MPTVAELREIEQHPEPAYREYDQVRAEAQAMSDIINPAELPEMSEVARRRGADWCTAVLGKPHHGLTSGSTTDARMLVIADRMGLTPPLPDRIARWNREDQELRDRLEASKRAEAERRAARWREALAGCEVADHLTVHTTSSAAQRRPNQHAVPDIDLHSKRGRHHAGRALCETPTRATPLHLSGPVDAPGTCVRCLDWMAQVQAGAPPQRHSWRKTAPHTYECSKCGTGKRNDPDPHGPGWSVTWTLPDGRQVGGNTPPCPGGAS